MRTPYCSTVPGAPTDLEVLHMLQFWTFRHNYSRINVTPSGMQFVQSNTLGFATPRDASLPPMFTSDTRCCEPVLKVLAAWSAANVKDKFGIESFPFTTVSLNSGFASKAHRDANNEGPSVAISLIRVVRRGPTASMAQRQSPRQDF